jgi:hypothetical protein
MPEEIEGQSLDYRCGWFDGINSLTFEAGTREGESFEEYQIGYNNGSGYNKPTPFNFDAS